MRDNGRNSIFTLVFCSALLFPVTLPAQTVPTATYRLIGTTEGPAAGAVFQDVSGQQLFYRLHEKLADGSWLVKVRNDSVALKSADGILYDMYISHDTKTVSAAAAPDVTAVPVAPPSPAASAPKTQSKASVTEDPRPSWLRNARNRAIDPRNPGERRPRRHASGSENE